MERCISLSDYLCSRPSNIVAVLAVALIIGVVNPAAVFATTQLPEKVIYLGDTCSMDETPLESYPDSLVVKLSSLQPELICTGLWRGYIGTWTIDRDSLWLIRVEKMVEPESLTSGEDDSSRGAVSNAPVKTGVPFAYKDLPLNEIFPDCDGPVFAGWFTGSLRLKAPGRNFMQRLYRLLGIDVMDTIVIEVQDGVVISHKRQSQ